MTCIVGINTGNKIIIAGDRMGSNGYTKKQLSFPKVFKKDDFIFGVCGSPRVLQLLEYKLNISKRYIGQSIDDYIYTAFTDSIIQVLSNNNALETKDGLRTMSSNIIFGYEDKLFVMQDNFQSISDSRGFIAAGSGELHAEASLYSTKDLNLEPKERLKRAIECANEFVMSVDDNIDMVELEYKKEEKKINNAKSKKNDKKTKR